MIGRLYLLPLLLDSRMIQKLFARPQPQRRGVRGAYNDYELKIRILTAVVYQHTVGDILGNEDGFLYICSSCSKRNISIISRISTSESTVS